MRPLTAIALTGSLLASTIGTALACGGIESWVDADPRAEFVASIDDVTAKPATGQDEWIELSVAGQFSSGGWSDAQLVPVNYVVEPYDGIWEIYVMAIPPEEAATQALTPYAASVEVPAGDGVLGYRLISGDSCVTILLEENGLPFEDGCRLQTATVS